MKQKMQALWEEVQAAEAEIGEGVAGALDRFISAGGLMVENFRMARSNFGKNRVSVAAFAQISAYLQGVLRVVQQRKTTRRNDLTSKALALQDRLERTLGCKLLNYGGQADIIVEDDEAPEPDKSAAGKYLTIRVTEFYGLGSEDWLNLIVKVGQQM